MHERGVLETDYTPGRGRVKHNRSNGTRQGLTAVVCMDGATGNQCNDGARMHCTGARWPCIRPHYRSHSVLFVTAIQMATLNNACSFQMEQEIGSLEVGKLADFIVLDRDIMQVPDGEIPAVRVVQTWVGGKRVFSR